MIMEMYQSNDVDFVFTNFTEWFNPQTLFVEPRVNEIEVIPKPIQTASDSRKPLRRLVNTKPAVRPIPVAAALDQAQPSSKVSETGRRRK